MANQTFHRRDHGDGENRRVQFQQPTGFILNADNDDFSHKKIKQATIINWIKSGIDKDTVEFANNFGEFIAKNGLTTSQIRTVFGEMKRIQLNNFQKNKTDFILTKPKLAYSVKRHDKLGLTTFYNLFSIAYDEVDTENLAEGEKQFTNLMNLLEAILAYHKFHGGRE